MKSFSCSLLSSVDHCDQLNPQPPKLVHISSLSLFLSAAMASPHLVRSGELLFDLRTVPVTLQRELVRQAEAACRALARLVIAYGHLVDAGQVSRLGELVNGMRRHMTEQVVLFMRYRLQGVMPTWHAGDILPQSHFFLLNRGTVFQNIADIVMVVHFAEQHRLHSQQVIAARTQMIVLIRDLMGNLLNRSAQDPSLAATLQNREEAMMAAATNYM